MKRILIVEDDSAYAILLGAMLSRTYEVNVVGDLKSAKEKIPSASIVLLDLGLPDSQGIDTCKQLAEISRKTPIIVLSGDMNWETPSKCLACGACEFIPKSEFSAKAILEKIGSILEEREITRQMKELADKIDSGYYGRRTEAACA